METAHMSRTLLIEEIQITQSAIETYRAIFQTMHETSTDPYRGTDPNMTILLKDTMLGLTREVAYLRFLREKVNQGESRVG